MLLIWYILTFYCETEGLFISWKAQQSSQWIYVWVNLCFTNFIWRLIRDLNILSLWYKLRSPYLDWRLVIFWVLNHLANFILIYLSHLDGNISLSNFVAWKGGMYIIGYVVSWNLRFFPTDIFSGLVESIYSEETRAFDYEEELELLLLELDEDYDMRCNNNFWGLTSWIAESSTGFLLTKSRGLCFFGYSFIAGGVCSSSYSYYISLICISNASSSSYCSLFAYSSNSRINYFINF